MTRKRLILPVSMICLLTCLTAAPASAQDSESPWTASLDTTFASRYLWRGFVLNDSPSMQPSVTAGYKGFSVNWWSNNSLKVPNNQAMTESDFTFDYSHSFDKLGLSAGYILYTFPDYAAGEGNRTHEIYVGASVDTLLSPSVTYYRDVDQGDGDYVYASIGHSVPLGTTGAALNLGTGVGLNHHQWIDITTVSNWDINVSVDIPWGKVTFSPFFTQMIGHETYFGKHNMFGVNMSVFSF